MNCSFNWILFLLLLLIIRIDTHAQEVHVDSIESEVNTSEQFYDSLKYKAYRHRITRFVYDNLISVKSKTKQENFDLEREKLNVFEGKIIATLKIQQMDIIGPSFADTARVSHTWLGQTSNKLHTQTNERIIKKNILLRVGDTLRVDELLENERIIRLLPYVKDVRFLVKKDSLIDDQVHVTVLTKDVFSFGLGGSVNGLSAAKLEIYNHNIWGIGHQFSAKLYGHVNREPYIGLEGFYTINNIGGNFINLSVGYADTYQRKGGTLVFDKEFLRKSTRWGGGLTVSHWKRTDRLIDDVPIILDYELDYRYLDLWSGYAFQLNKSILSKNTQLVLSGRMRHYKFLDRPDPDPQNNQYFANSSFYLASLSLSKRNYFRDHLIYSYGITEDIPKGYLHEWVVGYDNNEFNTRWYTHLYFSSGNFIKYKPSYLFASVGVGGFFNVNRYEQGQIEFNTRYISRLVHVGRKNVRHFIKLNYLLGIRRFQLEELLLSRELGIRGFNSGTAVGKQRLSVGFESVLFVPKHLLDFNFAFFGFIDLGLIGTNKHMIFNGNFYSGIGAGIRVRNENLVFRTLQLRLSYYPNHPADIGGLGVDLTERFKNKFYSFQPQKPDVLRFE